MFTLSFVRVLYNSTALFNLSSVAEILSLSGFEAVSYQITDNSKPSTIEYAPFVWGRKDFSVVLFVRGSTLSEYATKLNTVLSAFRQFREVNTAHRFIIQNNQTNKSYNIPVVIEEVSISKQTGFSATVAIRGRKKTLTVLNNPFPTSAYVTTSTEGLPKTVSFSYTGSFPAPLIIVLYGPINQGFQISRQTSNPLFDFTLTVGTTIPSGVLVEIDYRYFVAGGSSPVKGIQYLANPEIAPDLVTIPSSVNQFTLSGPSSTGTVIIAAYLMSWSIYE
jgi:hypothetical protein